MAVPADRRIGHVDIDSKEDQRFLRLCDLDPDRFPDEIRVWFETAVDDFYRKEMMEHLELAIQNYVGWQEEEGMEWTDDRTLTELADRINVHEATCSRWKSRSVKISWENLFLGATAFDASVLQGGFQRGRFVTRRAAMQAITRVRREHFGEDCGDLDLIEFECLSASGGDFGILKAAIRRDQTEVERCSEDIRRSVRLNAQRQCNLSPEEIVAIITDWLKSYVVFHTGIPFDWEF